MYNIRYLTSIHAHRIVIKYLVRSEKKSEQFINIIIQLLLFKRTL